MYKDRQTCWIWCRMVRVGSVDAIDGSMGLNRDSDCWVMVRIRVSANVDKTS